MDARIDWSGEIQAAEHNIQMAWESHERYLKQSTDATKRAAEYKQYAIEAEAKLKVLKKLRSKG